MNAQLILLAAATLLPFSANAQAPLIIPKPFTAFETRNTGKTLEHEPNLKQPTKTKKKVTFTAVTDMRNWKGANGTSIQARLLAFERTTSTANDPLPIIRDDRVRLLAHGAKGFSEIPLNKLSSEDQQFILNLDRSRKAPAATSCEAAKE